MTVRRPHPTASPRAKRRRGRWTASIAASAIIVGALGAVPSTAVPSTNGTGSAPRATAVPTTVAVLPSAFAVTSDRPYVDRSGRFVAATASRTGRPSRKVTLVQDTRRARPFTAKAGAVFGLSAGGEVLLVGLGGSEQPLSVINTRSGGVSRLPAVSPRFGASGLTAYLGGALSDDGRSALVLVLSIDPTSGADAYDLYRIDLGSGTFQRTPTEYRNSNRAEGNAFPFDLSADGAVVVYPAPCASPALNAYGKPSARVARWDVPSGSVNELGSEAGAKSPVDISSIDISSDGRKIAWTSTVGDFADTGGSGRSVVSLSAAPDEMIEVAAIPAGPAGVGHHLVSVNSRGTLMVTQCKRAPSCRVLVRSAAGRTHRVGRGVYSASPLSDSGRFYFVAAKNKRQNMLVEARARR